MASDRTSWARQAQIQGGLLCETCRQRRANKDYALCPLCERDARMIDSAYLPVISRLLNACQCAVDSPHDELCRAMVTNRPDDCSCHVKVAREAIARISPADLAAVEKWNEEHEQ